MNENKLVLVVDDDPDVVEAVSMKLESQKYRVAKAYDGIEAWDCIKEEKPALVILDVMMPRKDGYAVCDEIKKDPDYADIPVLLLTAVGSAVTSTSYTHEGGMNTLADDFIPKPVNLDKLMDTIGELI